MRNFASRESIAMTGDQERRLGEKPRNCDRAEKADRAERALSLWALPLCPPFPPCRCFRLFRRADANGDGPVTGAVPILHSRSAYRAAVTAGPFRGSFSARFAVRYTKL